MIIYIYSSIFVIYISYRMNKEMYNHDKYLYSHINYFNYKNKGTLFFNEHCNKCNYNNKICFVNELFIILISFFFINLYRTI